MGTCGPGVRVSSEGRHPGVARAVSRTRVAQRGPGRPWPARPAPVPKPGSPTRIRTGVPGPACGTTEDSARAAPAANRRRGACAPDAGCATNTGHAVNDQPERRAGMDQKDLVRQVAAATGLGINAATAAVAAVLEVVTGAIARDETVRLPGFGDLLRDGPAAPHGEDSEYRRHHHPARRPDSVVPARQEYARGRESRRGSRAGKAGHGRAGERRRSRDGGAVVPAGPTVRIAVVRQPESRVSSPPPTPQRGTAM